MLLILSLSTIVNIGCKKAEINKSKAVFINLEFDQQQEDITITPESEIFNIGFHKTTDVIPDNSIELPETILSIASGSSAKMNRHFTIPGYDLTANFFKVTYNKSESTGDFQLKVFPSEITEPVELVIYAPMTVDRKTTIRLIPAE